MAALETRFNFPPCACKEKEVCMFCAERKGIHLTMDNQGIQHLDKSRQSEGDWQLTVGDKCPLCSWTLCKCDDGSQYCQSSNCEYFKVSNEVLAVLELQSKKRDEHPEEFLDFAVEIYKIAFGHIIESGWEPHKITRQGATEAHNPEVKQIYTTHPGIIFGGASGHKDVEIHLSQKSVDELDELKTKLFLSKIPENIVCRLPTCEYLDLEKEHGNDIVARNPDKEVKCTCDRKECRFRKKCAFCAEGHDDLKEVCLDCRKRMDSLSGQQARKHFAEELIGIDKPVCENCQKCSGTCWHDIITNRLLEQTDLNRPGAPFRAEKSKPNQHTRHLAMGDGCWTDTKETCTGIVSRTKDGILSCDSCDFFELIQQ